MLRLSLKFNIFWCLVQCSTCHAIRPELTTTLLVPTAANILHKGAHTLNPGICFPCTPTFCRVLACSFLLLAQGRLYPVGQITAPSANSLSLSLISSEFTQFLLLLSSKHLIEPFCSPPALKTSFGLLQPRRLISLHSPVTPSQLQLSPLTPPYCSAQRCAQLCSSRCADDSPPSGQASRISILTCRAKITQNYTSVHEVALGKWFLFLWWFWMNSGMSRSVYIAQLRGIYRIT